MREGLRSLFERQQDDVEVVADTSNGHLAVRLAEEMLPDLVIIDVAIAGLNGIDASRKITSRVPRIKVIALSTYADVSSVSEMLRSGASGYLTKECTFEELMKAIHTVLANQIYLSPVVDKIVVSDYVHQLQNNSFSAFSVLTTRQREVLQLVAEGMTTREIADELHVSVKTVQTHQEQMMKKLGIHSIARVTKYAIRQGLTAIDR